MNRNRILRKDRCANPYNREGHVGKNLREFSSPQKITFPDFPVGSMICYKCRDMFEEERKSTRSKVSGIDNSISSSEIPNTSNLSNVSAEISLNNNNNIAESSTSDPSGSSLNLSLNSKENDFDDMMRGLKDKFSSLHVHDPDRIAILTALPTSWSIDKIAKEFSTTHYAVRKAKDLKKQNGSFSRPLPHLGKPLEAPIINEVISFYENDENSRLLGGMKNKKAVIVDGRKILKQKRLILFKLRDLHTKFCKEKGKKIIGFSKFCQLRPENCVLPGESGTHTVCVCVIHQNVKLMMDAVNLEKLTADTEIPLKTYHDCIDLTICRAKSNKCYLGECNSCPGTSKLRNHLVALLTKRYANDIKFSAWFSTDRATMKTITMNIEDFVDHFCSKLKVLKSHNFIQKQQSNYVKQKKDELKPGEFLIECDFSENYAFIVQEAAQAFHYNNNQATLYTAICYYREEKELLHDNFIIISDCTAHDANAVHICNTKIIEHLQKRHKVKKIIYVSDGAKQHFKNRYNIQNLAYHVSDCGIPAEWHFHVTAHGKGAHDGLGATLKILARKYSLQTSSINSILTAEQLYSWAKKNLENITVYYYSQSDHTKSTRHLKRRFDRAPAIPRIQSNHSFVPVFDRKEPTKIKLSIGKFSICPNKDIFNMDI